MGLFHNCHTNVNYIYRTFVSVLLFSGIIFMIVILHRKHEQYLSASIVQTSVQRDIQQILDENMVNNRLTYTKGNESSLKELFKGDKTEIIDTDRKKSEFRIANQVITDYRLDFAERFQETVDKKLTAGDKKLTNLILDMMDWPSNHIPKISIDILQTPQSKYVVDNIFKQKRNGFFVECGALDGERSSNTIWMEQYLHWTGLLIEADPYFYTQLLGKNRRSWSINACLSPSNHTEWLTFAEHSYGRGSIMANAPANTGKVTRRVPCFPLESILLAMNRTEVDFFSLDVEGLEMKILETVPHDRLNVKTWTIEFDKVGEETLKTFMERSGYKTETKIVSVDRKMHLYARDLIFVK